ncbi:MAG: exodeoxyribonuclease VII large subunit [Pacificimonas sp.]|jgi:exodeoxyribonuclease VII large subunit|nr:exodeoxyribonuclease VII large subunit [Pacificimonas sp.]
MASSPPETPADADAPSNAHEFTVGELSTELKRAVEDRFGHVRLRGEISGWKVPASGHAYFSLKDEKAVIDSVMWKTGRARLDFQPEDGLEVIAEGKVTTYPGRSKYQIVVSRMRVAGAGALMALLEKRRAALAAEGLFSEDRKRRLPFLPRRIGIVTSPTGAVIRDMLHRLSDRFPSSVILWPVKVQGDGAAEDIAAGIAGLNALPDGERPDLLIVARGGGSIEDLWAFNEEAVVRAVAGSAIPVISAVGHETDTTLCDFAADFRAPTPTAAAERAVPVRADLRAWAAEQAARLDAALLASGRRAAERVQMLSARLPDPAQLVETRQQRLDDLSARLPNPREILALRQERLSGLGERLVRAAGQGLRGAERDRASLFARLRPELIEGTARRADQRLADLSRLLVSLNPDAPLARGYAMVEDQGGALVPSAAAAAGTSPLIIKFRDGAVTVHQGAEPPARPKRRAAKPPAGQDSLF